jgi:transposase
MGGDVSKGYCDFVILNSDKKIVEPNFQLDDTPHGHKILTDNLRAFFARRPQATLRIGFESTGGYENNWYHTLLNLAYKDKDKGKDKGKGKGKGKGSALGNVNGNGNGNGNVNGNGNDNDNTNIKVTRLNPLGVRKYWESELERNKTDKISARMIAEYLISHPKNIIYNQSDSQTSAKKHWSFVKLLIKQCTQLKSQFNWALYNSQPYLLTYCKDGVPQWVFKLVEKYPTAYLLAQTDAKTVAQIPYVSSDRARQLINHAKISIGADQDAATACRIRSLVGQIVSLNKFIEEQIEVMSSYCCSEDLEILDSFKGIGTYSAVGLLFIIRDIQRFEFSKKLSSYTGVHPALVDSGDGTWVIGMSKKGSKEARAILFNVARSAVVNNKMIKELYEGYLAKGKCRMSAIGIIMHKILRIVYGMLKHRKKFDPSIDEANRNRTKEKEKEKNNNKNKDKARQEFDRNRRYQSHDQNAPISRRQNQKRKRLKKDTVKEKNIVINKGVKEKCLSKEPPG